MAWYSALLVVGLGVLGVRIGFLVRAVVRGKVPWPRLLLPSIIFLEGATLGRDVGWEVRLGTVAVLEVAFVVMAIRAVRRAPPGALPEVRIATALEAVVPPRFARLVALELVIVAAATRFLLGGWRRPLPPGFSYHRESSLRTLLPILPLLAFGDILLLELVVLANAATWLRVVLHVLAAYGLVWLVGLYATVRARPHRIVDGVLELHRGILRHRAIPLADIASIDRLPSFADDWKQRAYLKRVTRLDLAGPTVLELRLHDGTRVTLAVDDPAALISSIR